MKTIIFLLLMCSVAQADVYVLTDSNNAVIGLSEQNDIVVPSGHKISVIKGDIANLPISGDVKLYNFVNGTFTLNNSAVQAKQKTDTDAIAAQTAENNAKSSGLAKLKALGLTDAEINAITK